MFPTKLYLIVAGIAAHWQVEGDANCMVLLAKSLKNIMLHPIRSRRLTRRDLLKTVIASAVFVFFFAITVCGFAFYSVAQVSVSRPHLHIVAKYPRDILPGGFAEKVFRALNDDASGSKSNYRSTSREINKESAPLWEIEKTVTQFIVQPRCSNNAKLLVLITSGRDHFSRRNIIRDTWCSNPNADSAVQCVFLIGTDPDAQNNYVARNLSLEISRHSDILIANYQDTYRNLTYKVLSGFQWSVHHCKVPYVLKTDDDCFVNVGLFSKVLEARGEDSGLYAGRVFSEPKETQVIRDAESKWAVSTSQYNSEFYPPYASGIGYLLSQDVVQAFVEASKFLLPFPNEDAYIGVLADRLGIAPIDSGRFAFYNVHFAMCNLLYILVIHHVSSLQQQDLFTMTLKAPVNCHTMDVKTSWN